MANYLLRRLTGLWWVLKPYEDYHIPRLWKLNLWRRAFHHCWCCHREFNDITDKGSAIGGLPEDMRCPICAKKEREREDAVRIL